MATGKHDNDMTKILILINSDDGLYPYRRELIAKILEDYHVVICHRRGRYTDQLIDMGCEYIPYEFDSRGTDPVKDIRLCCFYRKLIREVKPDLVITYSIKSNVYGGMACRMEKVPYAANITGLGAAFQKDGLLKTLAIWLYKIGLKKTGVVFFENAGNQKLFIDCGIVSKDRTCLLNGAGVNLEHFSVSDYPVGTTTKFLFVGRIMREKGIDELFEAMRLLISEGINCSLDVLGPFAEEDYKETVDRFTEEGWLCYHGMQSDIRPYIASAHCLVLPSWHEGMSNAVLECAASGRPVITSNIHGCMEAVENGVTGFLCEKQNTKSLYEAMKCFIVMPYEERKAMGMAGRRRMEKDFDKRDVVNKTMNTLHGFVAKEPGYEV